MGMSGGALQFLRTHKCVMLPATHTKHVAIADITKGALFFQTGYASHVAAEGNVAHQCIRGMISWSHSADEEPPRIPTPRKLMRDIISPKLAARNKGFVMHVAADLEHAEDSSQVLRCPSL